MKILMNGKKEKTIDVVCGHCGSVLEGKEREFRKASNDRYFYTCPVCNVQRMCKGEDLVVVENPSFSFLNDLIFGKEKVI